jgi:hypothetical protein
MQFKQIPPKFFIPIKVTSTILIASAVGLESWHLYTIFHHGNIPGSLNLVFLIERFALSAHFLEAVLAAIYAPSRQETPIKWATYTFFVGTVGLLELFSGDEISS